MDEIHEIDSNFKTIFISYSFFQVQKAMQWEKSKNQIFTEGSVGILIKPNYTISKYNKIQVLDR